LLQAASADPIRAFLVFLNLLKRQAKRLAELFLAKTNEHAAHSNPATDMAIDRIWRFFDD